VFVKSVDATIGGIASRRASRRLSDHTVNLAFVFLIPRIPRWHLRRPALGTETLALIVSTFFVLACNQRFWMQALAGRDATVAATWVFATAMLLALISLHLLLLCLMLTRWVAKPLLSVLIVSTAFATYYMNTFSVYLDPNMLRNVLATEARESGEFLVPGMASHLFVYAGLPLVLLWTVRLRRRPLMRALLIRLATAVAAILVAASAILLVFQDLSSLMRNHKQMRYLVTPANFLYSTARALGTRTKHDAMSRIAVGLDAHLAATWQERKKPVLFVMVVGETARAANWGLNGYVRQTTPRLAGLNVVNFSRVQSCGTDTETSLPCMFSAIGRHDYDAARIRNSDSLLHLLRRVGFNIVWRDNNTGCKGVCADIGEERVDRLHVPAACDASGCLDEVLLHGLDTIARSNNGNLFVVLHQLGNHGPAYHKRYPQQFRRFAPTCDTAELQLCQRQEIVNAYDNAVLYTDDFLASTIAFLKAQEPRYDTALLYVSDHGESLGENGLYLHGMPYSIAPTVQKEVPMVMWFSTTFLRTFQIDEACLRSRARQPATHDNLVHTLLGMLQIETDALDSARDLSGNCRDG
jgi:lipid A ethanolaminephosphotransferase